MADSDRRSAKLHKQLEVEDYGEDDEVTSKSSCSTRAVNSSPVCGGMPTPTVQSASSSSGTSPDESEKKQVMPPPITRKQTLIRTQALEGTSPPPDTFFSQIKPNGAVTDGSVLPNGTSEKNNKKKLQSQSHEAKEYLLTSHKISNDSGHGTLDNNDGSSDTSVLSRDSSLENASHDIYKDSSGVNIPKFIRDTLLKGPKDKKTVLAIEAQLLDFIKSDDSSPLKTSEMTSYDRMIVHRLSAFLGLEHNVDATGKSVVVNKTERTRAVKLTDLILEDAGEEPKKKILLKKPASLDEKHSRHNSKAAFGSHRAKSLEERQQIYSEVRDRIFKQDENMPEGGNNSSHLTANYTPQISQQRSLDSMKSCSKWTSQESSGYGMENSYIPSVLLRANLSKSHSYGGIISTSPQHFTSMPHSASYKAESLKSSPNTHYAGTTYTCQMPLLSNEQSHLTRSTPDSGPSPLTHMQPHVNSDGTLYRFDPSCPPPFMVQTQSQPPPPTPPVGNIIYQQSMSSETMNEMTARFAASSINPVDASPETYNVGVQGQPVPIVPTILPHPHAVFTPTHPPQFQQGQYFPSPSSVANQQSVRYVAYPIHPQGQQQILQATPVDGQGQTTVPMPAVSIPAIPGPGNYQVIGAPFPNPAIAPGAAPQCVDLNSAYHYSANQDTVVVSTAGGVNASPVTVTTPAGLMQAFNIAYPGQPPQTHQHTVAHSHQNHFNPNAATPTGTTYYVPVSTPTPTSSLAQPPPSSHQFQHHQQHPQTVFYTPSNMAITPLTYPVTVSSPQQPTSSTFKSIPTPYLANQYRSSTPPQQQQHHQQLQPTASTNGHHSAQLTLNYSQPINFTPGPPLPHQGPQLVTFQANPYQVRPLGAVIQLASNPPLQAQQQQQQQMSYQLFRQAGAISDFKMMTQGAIHRQSSVTINTQNQSRPKGANANRQNKKSQRKTREVEDYSVTSQPVVAQNMGPMMAPLLQGSQTYQHMPSTSSNRQ
ncbi:cAMP-regulated phosphoprotein 21-like isoform X2 [Physella acuta]|uniref:cAMP-regulated phosphoprotein 21-like isoform X2 n=1 Tax=Physella acuta TaxID=109671 RepID=UPI0027DCD52A|nr:cAMP-regulated phosphoprotein 21-like isoform X2 [Physella acuta]